MPITTSVNESTEPDRAGAGAALRPAELQLLADLSMAFARGGRLADQFARIHAFFAPSLGEGYVGLLVAAGRPGEFMLAGSAPPLRAAGLIIPGAAALVAELAAEATPIKFFRSADLEPPWVDEFRAAGMEEHAVVLLELEGEPLGLLHLARPGPAFTEESIPLLRALDRLMAPAVAAERQAVAMESSVRRRQLVADLSSYLGAGEPLDTLFDRLIGPISRAIDFDLISLSARPVGGEQVQIVRTLPEVLAAGTPSPVTNEEFAAMLASGQISLQYEPERGHGEAEGLLAEAGYRRVLMTILRDREEAFGILALARTTDGRFTDEEEQFLTIVAAMFGQALANQHRLHRVEVAAARSRVLNEISLLLNGGEPIERVFDRLPGILQRGTGLDYVEFAERDPDGRFGIALSWPEREPAVTISRATEADIALIRGSGRRLVQYHPGRVPGAGAAALAERELTRVLTILVEHRGEVLGLFSLGRRAGAAWQADEEEFIGVVSTLLGQALANQRRLERVERAAARNRVLNEVSILLNAGEPPDTLFDRLPAILGRALQFDALGLGFPSDREGELDVRYWGGYEQLETVTLSVTGAGIDMMVRANVPLIQLRWPDISGALADVLKGTGITWGAVAFLRQADVPLGILHVGRDADRMFDADEMAFLEVLATLFGQAIAADRRAVDAANEVTTNQLLNRLSILLNAGEAAAGVFDSIEPLVRQAVNADFVALVTLDLDSGQFLLIGATPGIDMPTGRLMTQEECGIHLFATLDRVVAQYSTDAIDVYGARRFRQLGIKAAASGLLRDGEEVVGVLNVGRRDASPFSAREIDLLEVVCTLFAQASTATLRMERARREADDQRVVAAVAAAIARESDPAALVRVMNEAMVGVFPKPLVAFGFLEGETVVYPEPGNAPFSSARNDFHRRAEEEGQICGPMTPLVLEEGTSFAKLQPRAGSLTVTRSGGSVIGYLLIASRAEGYDFGPRELLLFRTIAQLLGPAMANARAAEQTARERALYDLVLQSLSEGVILIDHDLRAVYANAGGDVVVEGLRPIGDTLHELIPTFSPESQAAFQQALDGVAATGIQRSGDENGDTYTAFEAIPLHHPAYRLLIVTREVTTAMQRELEERRHREELDRAAAAVEQERTLYQTVLESLPEAIVLLDTEFRAIFENAGGRTISNALDPRRRHRTVEENAGAFPPDMQDDFMAAARDGKASHGRASVVWDEQRRWFSYAFIPIDRPPLKLLALANEVTAEVLREEEQERQRVQMEQASRLAALGELIGGVAHELNNPLTAILGFAEVMSLSKDAALFREEIDVVRKEALRASDVVRDLLFIARPGAAERGSVSLAEVIGHVERIRRSVWARLGIRATMDLSAVTAAAWGNEHQLTQVLLNLVTNAEQALVDRPDPALSIRAGSGPAGAWLEVRDNGAGMDDETRSRIFEPFYTTRQGTGTGLGLSISFGMVAAHGGNIMCDSSPGRGSTFRVTLPPPPEGEPAPASPPADSQPGARVLVIDDEPNVRTVCERLIFSLGHSCDVAGSVEEAIERATSGAYDLVICDYRLGRESADAVVEAFTRVAPHLVGRCVIATGAATDAGVIELTRRYGLRVMAKPYGIEDLKRALALAGR